MKEKIIIFAAGVLLGIILTIGVFGLIQLGGKKKDHNKYMNMNNRPQISERQNSRQKNKASRTPKEDKETKKENTETKEET